MRYLSIDIVRALAAVSVLFTHWVQSTDNATLERAHLAFRAAFWPIGLHPGVVTFIVLSGFCVHLPNVGRLRLDWSEYARRRFLRIAPLFWFASLLGAALVFAGRQPESSLGLWPALALRITFLSELGSPDDLGLGNFPLYTVISEMWLYAAYPVLILMRRWLSWPVVLASALIIQFTAYVGLPYVIADPDFASTGFWALWAFWVLGAWSAERFKAAQSKRTKPHRWRPWIVIAVCAGSNLVSLPWPFLAVLTVRSLVLAISVAIVLHDLMVRELDSDRQSLLSRALAWLGTRSYSLYATHAPVLVVAPVWQSSRSPSSSTTASSGLRTTLRAGLLTGLALPLIRTTTGSRP